MGLHDGISFMVCCLLITGFAIAEHTVDDGAELRDNDRVHMHGETSVERHKACTPPTHVNVTYRSGISGMANSLRYDVTDDSTQGDFDRIDMVADNISARYKKDVGTSRASRRVAAGRYTRRFFAARRCPGRSSVRAAAARRSRMAVVGIRANELATPGDKRKVDRRNARRLVTGWLAIPMETSWFSAARTAGRILKALFVRKITPVRNARGFPAMRSTTKRTSKRRVAYAGGPTFIVAATVGRAIQTSKNGWIAVTKDTHSRTRYSGKLATICRSHDTSGYPMVNTALISLGNNSFALQGKTMKRASWWNRNEVLCVEENHVWTEEKADNKTLPAPLSKQVETTKTTKNVAPSNMFLPAWNR